MYHRVLLSENLYLNPIAVNTLPSCPLSKTFRSVSSPFLVVCFRQNKDKIIMVIFRRRYCCCKRSPFGEVPRYYYTFGICCDVKINWCLP